MNLINQNEETNYYAVAYEGITSLYNIIENNEKMYLEPIIEKLFIILNNRKNHYGLYKFLDNSVRLDITGHVINGYFNLLKQ